MLDPNKVDATACRPTCDPFEHFCENDEQDDRNRRLSRQQTHIFDCRETAGTNLEDYLLQKKSNLRTTWGNL